ncbi:unnamed protein product, partial [Closterium sp. Yama58-4]
MLTLHRYLIPFVIYPVVVKPPCGSMPSLLSEFLVVADNCASVKCGPGGTCEKGRNGSPFCNCTIGFKPSFDNLTCIDNCGAVKCGYGGTCNKDGNGNPFCNCTIGSKPSADKLTCIDTCFGVDCGPNGKCAYKDNGDATCSCNAGFQIARDRLFCIRTECYMLGCEPEGTCTAYYGGFYCQWRSRCGSCPSGASCRTFYPPSGGSSVPYCQCPGGYGMTSTGCVQGSPDQVLASSVTLIQDESQTLTNASRPYTFRYKKGCNPFPKEVAGNYKSTFEVHNINGAPGCLEWRSYDTNNCSSTPLRSGFLGTTAMFSSAS